MVFPFGHASLELDERVNEILEATLPKNYGRDARSLFMMDDAYTNLNHGSFGTVPLSVHQASELHARYVESNPDRYIRAEHCARIDAARAQVAEFVGADPDTCVFIPSVAFGFATILRHFHWTSEDTIVCTDAIYNTISSAVKETCNRDAQPRLSIFALKLPMSHTSILRDFHEHIQSIKAQKQADGKSEAKIVVVIESITSSPAILMPWKEMVKICRAEKAWSIVDAAHSFGQELDLNLKDADPDFWLANGAKWCYAKRGCAILYVPFRNQDMIASGILPGLMYDSPGSSPTRFVWQFYCRIPYDSFPIADGHTCDSTGHGLVDPVPPVSIVYAIKFRQRIGGEVNIQKYCHALALAGGKRMAEIMKTTILDSPEGTGELIANMVNVELPLSANVKPSREIDVFFLEELCDNYKIYATDFFWRGRWWARSGHWESRIPTLDKLGVKDLGKIDELQVAKDWFQTFSAHVSADDVDGVVGLFCDDALWRDMLSLTWDMRTFDGSAKISTFLKDRLPSVKAHSFQLKDFVRLQTPFPGLTWIVAMFEFQTSVGTGSGVFRLVPTAQGPWKAYTMFTMLESFKDYPEKIGALRESRQFNGKQWREAREKELAFKDTEPAVLIVGAGQSALQLAARLKFLDIPTLMIERDERVGDMWRNRYDSLSLHFPVWNDHMPYIPFPPTWPKYTPSLKMAEWLEFYAKTLELNIWLSTTVVDATQDPDTNIWSVHVRRKDGSERTFKVKHFVVATGLGDGIPNVPDIPNLASFKGTVLHSAQYKRASDYQGKKVVVIGAGNAGHDVASDVARSGGDVTMYQRSSTFVMDLDKGWKFLGGPLYSEGGPPSDVADRLSFSMPHNLIVGGMAQRNTQAILNDQKEHLDKLAKTGFRINKGIKEAGILLQLKEKAGGHYFGKR
ncbi:hypothetical protein D9757_001270 [Collybiopsis confluens]|uniref:Aminotransferase class V domain-containing protein n=1 Tax=Collybiopsis confluens TaxID=2823264 RepID=A0A8H5I0U2_9AGAR|nr:hypothetical protein D9757_001270 [Collybiopsis confluens]